MWELSTLLIVPLRPASGNDPLGSPPVQVALTMPVSNVHVPTKGVATSEPPLLPPQAVARPKDKDKEEKSMRTSALRFRIAGPSGGKMSKGWRRMLLLRTLRDGLFCWPM